MDTTAGKIGYLRDLLRAVREITARVLENFSLEALAEGLQQRALLLQRIDAEKEALDSFCNERFWREHDHYREIRECVDDIRRGDRAAAALVKERMGEVRRELATLSDSSRAAGVYTRNSRF